MSLKSSVEVDAVAVKVRRKAQEGNERQDERQEVSKTVAQPDVHLCLRNKEYSSSGLSVPSGILLRGQ